MNSDKFIEFWNRVYYAAYSIHYVFSCYIIDIIIYPIERLFYSILNCIPAIKRRNKREGITFKSTKETAHKQYHNPESGHFMYYVNGFFSLVQALPFLLCISILEYYLGGCIREWWFNNLAMNLILIWGICLLLQYFFAWKHDRYLTYFAAFEKEGTRKRVVWTIGLLIVFVAMLVLTVYIFICAEKKHGFWRP